MTRLRPAFAWLVAASLFTPSGPIVATTRTAEEPPGEGASPLDPAYFDLLRRTLEDLRDDLRLAEPGIGPDALRGRLLVEARLLINNVAQAGLAPDQLLRLPGPLKAEAARLVDLVLGPRAARTDGTGDDPTPAPSDAEAEAPVRLRPYAAVLSEYLADRFEHLASSGAPDPAEALRREAIDAAARAVSPSNDPRDLLPAEREYASRLALRLAEGGAGAPDDPRRLDPALQDDLDALAELIRRKNAELKLAGERPGIDDRIAFLERFGTDRLAEAIRLRSPDAAIPEWARAQLRAIVELVARGVPFALRPDGSDPLPDEEGRTDAPDEPGSVIAPEVLAAIASLARAVDRALLVAGVDLPTRRATLAKFLREQAARKSGISVEALTPEAAASLDRLVEAILAEGGGSTAPPARPVILPPTVITVPPVVPVVPVSPRPGRPWWCPPWR